MDKEGIRSLLKANEAAKKYLDKEYIRISLFTILLVLIAIIGRIVGLILIIGMFIHWFNNSSMTFMEIIRESLLSHSLWWIYWVLSIVSAGFLDTFRHQLKQTERRINKVDTEISNLKSELDKIE